MLFMVYPGMVPSKAVPGEKQQAPGSGAATGALGAGAASKVERVMPKIFGFQVHEAAKLQRWQAKVRDA